MNGAPRPGRGAALPGTVPVRTTATNVNPADAFRDGGPGAPAGAIVPAMIDLHAHTTYSDGTFSPRAARRARGRIGLSAVAVTDHDSVDGIDEALAAGGELGVEVVPGVEINLEHAQTDRRPAGLLPRRAAGRRAAPALSRAARLPRRAQRPDPRAPARRSGYPVEPDELAAIAGSGAAGRPHIGEAMRRRGYVASITEAFERFLARGAPAWVDRRRLSLPAAVRLVRRADGLAVIAHPGIIRTDEAGLARLVAEARALRRGRARVLLPANTTSRRSRAASRWRPPTASCRPAAPTFTGRPNPTCGWAAPTTAGPCPTPSSPASRRAGPQEHAAREAGAPEPAC